MNPPTIAQSHSHPGMDASYFERVLRAIAGWMFAVLFWTLLISAIILSFRKIPAKTLQKFIRFWARTSLRILGVKWIILGEPLLDEQDARVVVCNHQSALDIVWGGLICPPDPLVIGKKEIVWVPVLNAIWWAFRFIHIDRQNRVAAITRLKGVAEFIRREKRSLIVAPEGTRSPTGQMLPFKKGPFHVAVEGQIPLIPVVVEGAFHIWPKTTLLPRPGVLILSILPPISTEGLGREKLVAVMSDCEARMKTEFERLQAMHAAEMNR